MLIDSLLNDARLCVTMMTRGVLRINSDCALKNIVIYLLLLMLVVGCGESLSVAPDSQSLYPQKGLAPLGYAVQVGAFSKLSNAVRLSETLQQRGLNAYYFVHRKRLYKVRFGNFPSRKIARKNAEDLHIQGVINEYYIIGPNDYPKDNTTGRLYLRSEIVRTAKQFLGDHISGEVPRQRTVLIAADFR